MEDDASSQDAQVEMEAYDYVSAVGMSLYATLFAVILLMCLWVLTLFRCRFARHILTYRIPYTSPKTLFLLIALVFLALRVAWVYIKVFASKETRVSNYIVNRIAFLLMFTCFSLIIFYWAEHLLGFLKGQMSKGKEGFFQTWLFRWMFLFVNAVAYIFQAAIIIHFYVHGYAKPEEADTYNPNIIVIDSMFLLMSLTFLVFGVVLLVCLLRVLDRTPNKQQLADLVMMLSLIAMVSVCFALRFVFFLYRPVTGKFLPDAVFVTFAYFVPELLPLFALSLFEITRRRRRVHKEISEAGLSNPAQYNYLLNGELRGGGGRHHHHHGDEDDDDDVEEDFSATTRHVGSGGLTGDLPGRHSGSDKIVIYGV